MVQYTLGVTRVPVYKTGCRSTMDDLFSSNNFTTDFAFLVLDYSNDNGLTWSTLESWPLKHDEEKRWGVVLPHSARTPSTILRWWQLTRPGFENQSNSFNIRKLFRSLGVNSFVERYVLVYR